jgi:hypothetical protein
MLAGFFEAQQEEACGMLLQSKYRVSWFAFLADVARPASAGDGVCDGTAKLWTGGTKV